MPLNIKYPAPIDVKQVEGFLRVWRNGVYVFDAAAKQFAADFATIVLRSFIDLKTAQALKMIEDAKKAMEEKNVNNNTNLKADITAPGNPTGTQGNSSGIITP